MGFFVSVFIVGILWCVCLKLELKEKLEELSEKVSPGLAVLSIFIGLILAGLAVWGFFHLTYHIDKTFFPSYLEESNRYYELREGECDLDSQTGRWICP